ncbi:hypothetical protein QVD17_30914 [Tagetes erecta]|uniref:Endonuclease/exonuclease/phosphatase domain-containing protein n=1 Tax=Tagetes erecta TaxID=13708 RepID=A0AAD8NNE1_TARER|nr:hypothetical protein QVD17_30914 [Tagetes erecta]
MGCLFAAAIWDRIDKWCQIIKLGPQSFKDALLNKTTSRTIIINPKKADKKKQGAVDSFVADAKNLETLSKTYEICISIGLKGFSIRYPGGLSIIITSKDALEVDKIIQNGNVAWKSHWQSVIKWTLEEKQSAFNQVCAGDFNDFIFRAGLMEFRMKGKRFTYLNNNGRKCSRIDRIMLNQVFLNSWPLILSDHPPLILITNPLDFGLIPFRFIIHGYNILISMSSSSKPTSSSLSWAYPNTDS